MTIKKNWGEDPEFYGPRDWFRNTLIINEVCKVYRSGTVLDFGCGTGHLIVRLASIGFRITGVDASKLSVNYLRDKLRLLELSRSATIVNDDERLVKIKEKFNVITAGEVVEHIKQPRIAIKNFHRLLKRNGLCVITVPAHQWLWDDQDVSAGHFKRYEASELCDLFCSSGFKIIKVKYFGFPITLLWHKLLFKPMFQRRLKVKSKVVGGNLFGRLIASNNIKKLLSNIFWLDNLFNWTRLGNGIILVAQK